MSGKKAMWTCDFKGCNDVAQWLREFNGQLLNLCTKHEAYLANKHLGEHKQNNRTGTHVNSGILSSTKRNRKLKRS